MPRPTHPARCPRPRLAADDRRGQILAAAFELCAERGFHGARTRDLARRAGVSEALVYRHFPSKDALIRAILDQAGFAERIEWMEQTLEKMPPREALLSIAKHLLTGLRERPEVFRVVFFGLLETPHLASEFYRDFLSRVLALETRIFERAFRGAKGSRSAPFDPAVAARSFHGSLMFYNTAGAIVRMEPLPRDPEALAEAIVNLYIVAPASAPRAKER
jgi:TetR/AcrR family transcriptional regulator